MRQPTPVVSAALKLEAGGREKRAAVLSRPVVPLARILLLATNWGRAQKSARMLKASIRAKTPRHPRTIQCTRFFLTRKECSRLVP